MKPIGLSEASGAWARYLVALVAVLAGIVTRAGFTVMGAHRIPYVAFYPFIVLAAFFGGTGPGLMAVLLFAAAGAYWLPAAREPVDELSWVMFVAGAGLVALVSAAIRAQRQRARESALELEAIFNSLRQPVIVFDAGGRPRRINAAAREVLGTDITTLDGAGYERRSQEHRARRPDGSPVLPEQWPSRRALQGQTVLGEELVVTDASGREATFEVSGIPFRAAGQVIGAVSVLHDITERKRAEEALRESEERYRQLIETANEGIWIMDREGRTTFVNAKMAEMLGYGPDEMAGRSLMDFMDESVRQAARENLRRRAQGLRDRHEFRFRRRDGQDLWTLVSSSPILDAQGRYAGALKMVADITDHKRLEQSLRERAEEVETLMQVLPVPVWIAHDPACRRITGNRAAQQFLGVEPGANVSQTAGPAERTPPIRHFRDGRELSPADLPIQWAAAHGEEISGQELALLLPNGTTRYLYGSAVPLFDANRSVRGAIGVYVDLTERKHVEHQLEAATLEAERANAAKDRFLAILSHELRNPLTPAMAAASALADDPRLPEDAREDAAMIRRNVGLETRLIEDLLDLTRISRGKLSIQLQPVDVVPVLREAMEMCSADADAKDLRLTLDAQRVGRAVNGDPARLEQVFWNLIKNAIKFTPEGGSVTVRVRAVGTTPTAERVTIEVTDTGRGIDAAFLPRVFEAFEQAAAEGSKPSAGLGLGLAICKGLVEAHGGSICADSPGKGRGATFTVELPLVDEPLPAHEPAAPAGGVPAVAGEAVRVLLVEDHADTARILRRLLQTDGYDVTTAGDVATAVTLAREERFDVLVSDIGLPDGSGFDLLAQLTDRTTMKAIALSGHGTEAHVAQTKAAGFAEHLVKPIDLRTLEAAIGRVTGRVSHVRRASPAPSRSR